jgi:tetratricopeptide (TPR) repeat protein
MHDGDVFIGRQKELQMIKDMIFDPEERNHIFPILGEGGVGKTWLLRELARIYHNDPHVLIIKTEFSEVRSVSMPTLSFDVFKQFSTYFTEDERQEYLIRVANWEKVVNQENSSLQAQEEEEQIYMFGFQLIMRAVLEEKKRLLFLSDTLETVKSQEHAHRINILSSRFPNSVIVVVGRPTPIARSICATYPDIYTGWVVHEPHLLEPFSNTETLQYLDEMLALDMPADLREKIFLLTGGKPVLIAITSEWLRRNVNLPADIDMPLTKLRALDESTLNEHRRLFEFGLIDKIRTLRQPIDQASLYLAYINRRYDRKLLKLVMDIDSEDELDILMEELKSLVFVRKSMSTEGGLLHDEAQRLIQEHAWPIVDPDGSLRRSLARKVIQYYYLPEIDRLAMIIRQKLDISLEKQLASSEHHTLPSVPEEDWLKRELQIECLDYHFRISATHGWSYLDELFEEALHHRYSLIQMDAIIGALHVLAPRQANSTQFQVRVAEILIQKGEHIKAARLAHEVLATPGITTTEHVKVLMILSDSVDDPPEKIAYLEQALEQARQTPSRSLIARVYNSLGLVYRRQGRWHKAAAAFTQALQFMDEQANTTHYANTLNNLAFVQMLNGHLYQADNLAEKALHIRKLQGNDQGLSFSYATKGRIAEAMGDYTQAARYHRIAVDLCSRIGDDTNAAVMQINVAASERRSYHFESARQLLWPGLHSELPPVRARALYQAGCVDMDEAESLTRQRADDSKIQQSYASARQYMQHALDLARQTHDNHLMAEVLLHLALITYLTEQREDSNSLQALEAILANHEYVIERGRMMELQGDLVHQQGDIDRAFAYYVEACDLLARYNTSQFRQTFGRVREKFFSATPYEQAQICQRIRSRLLNVHPAAPIAILRNLCDDTLFSL